MAAPPDSSASVLRVDLPNILRAGVLNAAARSGGTGTASGFSEANASVAKARVGNDVTPVVRADLVTSRCRADANGVRGSSELTNLQVRIGGLYVTQTAAVDPNTRIDVGNIATVILNEQTATGDSITVNAVRVVLFGASPALNHEVVLAQSRCTRTTRTTPTTKPTTTTSDPKSTTTTDPKSTTTTSDPKSTTTTSDPKTTTTTTDPKTTQCTGTTLFNRQTPTGQQHDDGQPVEVGVRLTMSATVRICGVLFYAAPALTGSVQVGLWDSAGTSLGSATTTVTGGGWHFAPFAAPITVAAGTSVTASYHSSGPYWAHTNWSWPTSNGALEGTKGAYSYGPSWYPAADSAHNYWVDVVAVAGT